MRRLTVWLVSGAIWIVVAHNDGSENDARQSGDREGAHSRRPLPYRRGSATTTVMKNVNFDAGAARQAKPPVLPGSCVIDRLRMRGGFACRGRAGGANFEGLFRQGLHAGADAYTISAKACYSGRLCPGGWRSPLRPFSAPIMRGRWTGRRLEGPQCRCLSGFRAYAFRIPDSRHGT